MKKLKFLKIKCKCGYTNLIPAYENTKCEKCGKVLAEPKELIEFKVAMMTFLPRVL